MAKNFTILGIESSCDETAAAIVSADKSIHANKIASQIETHAKHGGVVPEVAARAHLDMIDDVIASALTDAGMTFEDIDGVAATAGPGLIGGVIVGTVTAKAIAAARSIPYYAVNHLEGHALSGRLCSDIGFPYLLLLVSGGHTQLLAVTAPGIYRRMGTTMDDAAGEAFDKCAKIMELGYPGGPAIEQAAVTGNARSITLPRPLRGADNCHFSFSGLKTALATKLAQLGGAQTAPINDLAASLQAAIADCLADRTRRAMQLFAAEISASKTAASSAKTLVIAGGVAANKAIFARLQTEAETAGFQIVVPPAKLCTDNAAMIAWAALERRDQPDQLDFEPRPRWQLDPDASPPPGRGVRQ
ncbi:tRNA (adenosine(37)-N6)-threonylcarbamoyltransferase complex transferase subunit TsaD [Alphaproteobacteria bacterium]|nr:tRNA (adenosine(37)-N6)-threonylcarbamoyltransferase complex transferase subunit TsaD [Alphaproteobacteria bacterium]